MDLNLHSLALTTALPIKLQEYMVPPEGIELPTSWLQVSCTA